ncbi:hypothetical protein LOK49_LG11G02292 [Camellia lanceoleosa]|uniref:Uncharacterized protein n=1 Tax=Camellia lanceoleosa TaxID=1840588 RepID=A0ACC0G457_9ERIC|nr:hypothetical protein LOK49_LG11G02292 [Camellia lanceoleosa]
MGINRARPNVKYLGLPTVWGRSKAAAYGYLLEKMAAKMQGWKNHLLSHAGREARNDLVFNSVPVNPSDTLQRIHHGWHEYFLQEGDGTRVALADDSVAVGTASGWTPPREGTVKVNCDASFHRASAKASAAAIMRDAQGQFLDGIVTSFFSASTLHAEAVAVRLACRLVQMYGLSLADIENDNQELIHLCVSETVPPWEIMAIVADIRSFARDRD